MPMDRVTLTDYPGTGPLTGATKINNALFQSLQDKIDAFVEGAWVTPAFSAANFTGSGDMTWTVAESDVAAFRYRVLGGNTMVLNFALNTTTVGGTPNTELRIAIPGGYQCAIQTWLTLSYVTNAGSVEDNAIARALGAGTYISIFRDRSLSTNWSAWANDTAVRGSVVLQVEPA